MIGDLIAFETDKRSMFSRLISKLTNSNITHVGVMLDKEQFVEATLTGIRISTLAKVKDRPYWICRLKAEHRGKIRKNRSLFDSFVTKQLHKPYDFIQIAKFIPFILSLGIYTPKEDNKLYVCSELASAIYELMGIIKDVNTSTIAPIDAFNLPIYESRRRYTQGGRRVFIDG